MKIAFVGKGGSGKTTLSSLFIRHLAEQQLPVVAIDADINQHLGEALGVNPALLEHTPQLSEHLKEIKDYLRGNNPRIQSANYMVKTTPAGRGSRLLRVGGNADVYSELGVWVDDTVRLMLTGAFTEADLGVACYHGKTAAVELYLNHLLDGPREYVVVDMTAGADSFASGLCAKFDVTFMVVEPTKRSVGVYEQYKKYAAHYGITLRVIGNKVLNADDYQFLSDRIGSDLLTCIGHSEYVRCLDQGYFMPFSTLEREIASSLRTMQCAVNATPQNWERFQRLAVTFHERNAAVWGNTTTGVNLTAQVDPEFVLSPELLAR